MTCRERVIQALNHRQPDCVPVDFGATATSGMHCSCVADLRTRFGLDKRPVKVHEPFQMLGLIEADLQDAMGVDVQAVTGPKTIFGFANQDWKPWRAPWGQELLVPGDFRTATDAAGDIFIYPQGDTSVPPSGHMPKSGFFFDAIIRQPPIADDHLDPADNLEEFGPISEADLQHYVRVVSEAGASGRALVAGLPGTAIGDIALVPAPFLKHPKGIRDVAEWYMATAARQDYLHQVFSRQVEIALGNLARIHAAIGNTIAAVFLCGTDFGTQSSSFCANATYRSLYMPYYRQMNDWIHRHTTWKTLKHSCGAVEKFMNDFIASGFDILNPVQCSAAGMDPEHLKKAYGDRLTFWGGGVDTQKVLPFGTPAQVREQVLRRCEIFAPGGGFVFNAIHNVQAGTPVANIVAMLEAVREFNRR